MESSNQKTLSNSTLSLRFMQNAHRMKQQATVQAAQAKVKDDAEWEVPKHVREAWGLRSSEIESEYVVSVIVSCYWITRFIIISF